MGIYDDTLNELDARERALDSETRRRRRRSEWIGGGRRAHYERVLATYSEKLARLDRYPELDPYDDDTVLLVRRPMRTDTGENHVLTYAALRAGGYWWVSGKRELSGMSWEQLVEWLVTPITTVRTRQDEAFEVTLLVPVTGTTGTTDPTET